MTIFRHESFCGSCEQDECPEVPSCARREDSRFLLHCEHCPAAYHYCCAGYYDSQGASVHVPRPLACTSNSVCRALFFGPSEQLEACISAEIYQHEHLSVLGSN